MKVRNVNNTSDTKCKCGSWLNHWANFSHRTPQFCSAKNCNRRDLEGAHVQKELLSDNTWYIIPLCTEHNQQRGKIVEIFDDTIFVPANKQETCERTTIKLRVTKKQ